MQHFYIYDFPWFNKYCILRKHTILECPPFPRLFSWLKFKGVLYHPNQYISTLKLLFNQCGKFQLLPLLLAYPENHKHTHRAKLSLVINLFLCTWIVSMVATWKESHVYVLRYLSKAFYINWLFRFTKWLYKLWLFCT